MNSKIEESVHDVLYPFTSESGFKLRIAEIANRTFSEFGYHPILVDANIVDAFWQWKSEIEKWTLSIDFYNEFGEGEYNETIPSHWKKAGALACSINRTKPVAELTKRYSYQDGQTFDSAIVSDYLRRTIRFFPSEYLAIEVTRIYLLKTEFGRKDMGPLQDFIKKLDLEDVGIFSEKYVRDLCFYLRRNSPSPSSLYMVFRSYFAISQLWRRLNQAGEVKNHE